MWGKYHKLNKNKNNKRNKRKINKFTIIVGDCKIHLLVTDLESMLKISRGIKYLKIWLTNLILLH